MFTYKEFFLHQESIVEYNIIIAIYIPAIIMKIYNRFTIFKSRANRAN